MGTGSFRFPTTENSTAVLLAQAYLIYPGTIRGLGEGGGRVSKRKDTYVVTHAHASDPDPRRVKAALEAWQLGLAEQMMAGGTQAEKPIARIQVGPRRRVRKPRAAGGHQHE